MMSWASNYIKVLQDGNEVKFRPKGNSMSGKIDSGNLVTVSPKLDKELQIGNIVLCKVKGKHYLHIISAIKNNQYQISNNKKYVNGWISKNNIFGILTKVEK